LGVRRSYAAINTASETVFDVIVRRVDQDQLFFENLAVASLVVPNLSVVIPGLQDSFVTLFLSAHMPCRTVVFD